MKSLDKIIASDKHGFDKEFAIKFNKYYHKTLYSRYFRTELLDLHNIPSDGALLVANHSGSLPYDALNLAIGIHHETGRFVRGLVERYFRKLSRRLYRIMNKHGSVEGKKEDAIDLLKNDELVLVFPGGAPDIGKLWHEKYTIPDVKGFKKGKGGYIKCAIEAEKPIIPVAIVGCEEIHTNLYNSKWLAKKLKMPHFPFILNPIPVPAKVYIKFGEPMHFSDGNIDDYNSQVKNRLQSMINELYNQRDGVVFSKIKK